MKSTSRMSYLNYYVLVGLFFVSNCSPFSSAFFNSARSGDFAAIKRIVDKGENLNLYEYGWTPLLWAVYYQHIPIVEYLLDHGADPNLELKYPATDYQRTPIALRSTPLIIASFYGSTKIVKKLLEKNADPERADKYGYKAIDYAEKYGFEEIIKLLMKK